MSFNQLKILFNLLKFLSLIALISCQGEIKNNLSDKIVSENLNSVEKRNVYLENIYGKDQELRKELNVGGLNDFEEQNLWSKISIIDSLNFNKIEKYLNTYGYPDTINYSRLAVKAPWFVIQHCANIELREKYYKIIEQAHKERSINDVYFYLYLVRNYQIKKSKMLGIEDDKVISVKKKIEILLDTLKYEDID